MNECSHIFEKTSLLYANIFKAMKSKAADLCTIYHISSVCIFIVNLFREITKPPCHLPIKIKTTLDFSVKKYKLKRNISNNLCVFLYSKGNMKNNLSFSYPLMSESLINLDFFNHASLSVNRNMQSLLFRS